MSKVTDLSTRGSRQAAKSGKTGPSFAVLWGSRRRGLPMISNSAPMSPPGLIGVWRFPDAASVFAGFIPRTLVRVAKRLALARTLGRSLALCIAVCLAAMLEERSRGGLRAWASSRSLCARRQRTTRRRKPCLFFARSRSWFFAQSQCGRRRGRSRWGLSRRVSRRSPCRLLWSRNR